LLSIWPVATASGSDEAPSGAFQVAQ